MDDLDYLQEVGINPAKVRILFVNMILSFIDFFFYFSILLLFFALLFVKSIHVRVVAI